MTAVKFGVRVRKRRETGPKLSLTGLASLVGVSPAYLSRVERGEDGPPSEPVIRKIANELSLDGDELCALAGRIPQDIHAYVTANPKVIQRLRRETQKAEQATEGMS